MDETDNITKLLDIFNENDRRPNQLANDHLGKLNCSISGDTETNHNTGVKKERISLELKHDKQREETTQLIVCTLKQENKKGNVKINLESIDCDQILQSQIMRLSSLSRQTFPQLRTLLEMNDLALDKLRLVGTLEQQRVMI